MINWRNTRPQKLEGENEITRLFETTRNIAHEFGFEYCAFTMGSHLPNHPTEPIQINNYPSEWNTLYKRENYFAIDPVVAHSKRSVLPLLWEEKTFKEVPDLWAHAANHGLHIGWTQAVHDFRGTFSMLTLGRGSGTVNPSELYENAGQVLWLCHTLHEAVAREYPFTAPVPPATRLSPREIDVLRWASLGKTAGETARILCVSERTVGFHSQHAMQKLGVNNKIAAVITAVKAGLL